MNRDFITVIQLKPFVDCHQQREHIIDAALAWLDPRDHHCIFYHFQDIIEGSIGSIQLTPDETREFIAHLEKTVSFDLERASIHYTYMDFNEEIVAYSKLP